MTIIKTTEYKCDMCGKTDDNRLGRLEIRWTNPEADPFDIYASPVEKHGFSHTVDFCTECRYKLDIKLLKAFESMTLCLLEDE